MEPDAPYNRPSLSKVLWKGKPLDSIWRKAEDKGVGMHLGRVVKQIVPDEKRVVDDKGDVFTYEKLLSSTGGRPRRLAFDDVRVGIRSGRRSRFAPGDILPTGSGPMKKVSSII